MKRITEILAVAGLSSLLLSGCSQSSGVEDAVRSNLKDPESAKFKELMLSDSGHFACVSWNAKNSFGGYGNWDTALLKKTDLGWVVENMKIEGCSEHVKQIEDLEKAAADFDRGSREILEIMKRQKAGT